MNNWFKKKERVNKYYIKKPHGPGGWYEYIGPFNTEKEAKEFSKNYYKLEIVTKNEQI